MSSPAARSAGKGIQERDGGSRDFLPLRRLTPPPAGNDT
jgi:hypothetical protein